MDPEQTLKQIHELLLKYRFNGGGSMGDDDASEFFDLVEALDQWMGSGGAIPSAWRRYREGE